MKKSILTMVFCLMAVIAFSQTVSLDSIARYEGKIVTVCATVQSTYETSGTKKTTFIQFGKPFPRETFKIVIFESDLPNFNYQPSIFLKYKNICVTGKVSIYKGRPEIIVHSEKQIRIDK